VCHFMRKIQPRRTRTKNGDAQITTSCITVIQDVCTNAFLIRIHLRHALCRAHLPLEINLRCAIKVRVTDLITGYGHCGTNRRCAKDRASPITEKSEMHFNLARR
jgi:hypothetical protein